MAVEWSNPLLCVSPPCPPSTGSQQYQPLPISTGNVGIDRCGNITVYAAPNAVQAPVSWPACGWPVPYQGGWGPGAYGSALGGLASVLTGRAR